MFNTPEALQRGNVLIAPMSLSDLYFKDEKRFPWFILVPRREVEELFELGYEDSHVLMDEVRQVQTILKKNFDVCKINVGALGNKVRALHVHVVGRSERDPYWPEGIWQAGFEPDNYDKRDLDAITLHLREQIKEATQ